MRKTKYFILVTSFLLIFVIFQFSCVKRISRFQPGDEFLYILLLMSEKKYDTLLSEVDEMNLSSLKQSQANKIAYMASIAAMNQEDFVTAEKYLKYCLSNYREMEDYAIYNLSQVYSSMAAMNVPLRWGKNF